VCLFPAFVCLSSQQSQCTNSFCTMFTNCDDTVPEKRWMNVSRRKTDSRDVHCGARACVLLGGVFVVLVLVLLVLRLFVRAI